jgi:hypothetical protein
MYLRGISLLVMGSYPTQATPAFSQLAQLGSFWSQRFLRSRQRLHALTFRKPLLWPALPPPAPAAPLSCRCSLVGDVAPADGSEVGESLSGPGDDWRTRLEGWRSGEGGECSGAGIFVLADGSSLDSKCSPLCFRAQAPGAGQRRSNLASLLLFGA